MILVLYGAGRRARNLTELKLESLFEEVRIVDSDSSKWGTKIDSYVIEPPEILNNICDIAICITVGNIGVRNEIRQELSCKYPNIAFQEVDYINLLLQLYQLKENQTVFNDEVYMENNEVSVIFDCLEGLILGGIEEWTKGICEKIIKEGRERTYILSREGDFETPEIIRDSILYIKYNRGNAFDKYNIENIIHCIEEHLPCVVVTSKPNAVLFAVGLLKDRYPQSVKVISGIHGDSKRMYQSYNEMRSCTDEYVCVSTDIRKTMIKRGILPDKIHTMICPVECPDELSREYTVNKTAPVRLGFAGRITVLQKRMDLLLRMLDELENQNVNYCMEFAGEGDFLQNILEYIKKRKLHNKIKCVGKLDKNEIQAFWQDKDICVNIADYEGRSLSIVEAMANGAVPVVTNTSGVNDDIINGENGFIVDIGDYKEMARCIKRIDDNRDMLPLMGMKAHLELKDKCNMDNHYQFWVDLLDRIWENV